MFNFIESTIFDKQLVNHYNENDKKGDENEEIINTMFNRFSFWLFR